MYKFLLYSNGFNTIIILVPHGSAQGGYVVSLGLRSCRKKCVSSARVLCLTPVGVFTNQVLDFLIPDINNKRATKGFDCIDARGRNSGLFFDMCGYFEDNPASSQVIDVMQHMAGAPCIHRFFGYRGYDQGQNYN